MIRRGSTVAFEVLVSRYHARLLAFCRHLLGSREDAEDVLQEVFSAAFNAILDDDRPINVRPWLYRIARNRSLNHLRRIQAVGMDSMDIHLSDHGSTTADKVHEREEFRLLVGDIQGLPETQRTALVLREMDALSYEQIAEAMETTVPSVKSLLVRARVSLAEAAQARMLTCEEVRVELGEVAEGLRRRPGALVRRHLRACDRCSTFKSQLNETSKALGAVLPIGGFALLRKLAILHLGHSAGAGSSASGATAAGQAAAVGSTAAAGAAGVMGSTSTGFLSASVGAIATKAAAGLAAAALVTAGAVEVDHSAPIPHHTAASRPPPLPPPTPRAATPAPPAPVHSTVSPQHVVTHPHKPTHTTATTQHKPLTKPDAKKTSTTSTTADPKSKTTATKTLPGRTQTQTEATVLPTQTIASTTPAVTPAPTSTCTDPSSADTTTTTSTTTATTPDDSSDPGTTSTATQPDSTDTTTTSTPTTTSTTPAPESDSSSSCAADSTTGSTTTTQSPSGGAAP